MATKCSLDDITSQLYARNIITESVKDSMNYSNMMQEFDAKITLTNNVSELKLLCEAFLECICQGGPTDNIIETLAVEWNKVFETELLLPRQMTSAVHRLPSPLSFTGAQAEESGLSQVAAVGFPPVASWSTADRAVSQATGLRKAFSSLNRSPLTPSPSPVPLAGSTGN